MTDPNPGSTEAIVRKSSWPLIVIGGAIIYIGISSESNARKGNAQSEYYQEQVETGRLKVDSGTRALIYHNSKHPSDTDYTGTIGLGILLLLLGFGFSLYANKLRKARTGE